MPLNETQFRVAKALNKKQQERLWGLADREDTSFDDPEYAKTADAFKSTSEMIRSYEASSRKVDEQGKLTSEPETRLPATIEAAPSSAKGAAADALLAPTGQANPPGYNYFFEPNVQEVQTLLRKRPEVVKRLKLDQLMTGISSPEKSEDVLDPVSGMKMGENRVAARTHLENLTTDDSQYKDVADYLYQERMEEARANGISLQRYRDVPLKGHVPDFLAGGAIYNIERRLTPGVLGAADAMTLGLASPAGDFLTEKIGDAAKSVGMDIGPQPTAEDVRNRSPFSYMVGNVYGYGLPNNPTNILQQGMYDQGMKAAGKLYAPGAATKVAMSGIAGGGTNSIEGAVGDFGRELGDGGSVSDATKAAVTGMPLNWVTGAAVGGAADLAGQLAGAGREGIRTQEHLMMPLKALREGGGDTSMLRGVTAPAEVHEHIRAALEDGAVGSPAARAAEVVAPRIQASLERQDAEATKKIGSQMDEYYAHPKYNKVKVSSKPLVRALVDMISEGRFHAPVSGAATHMDQDAIRTIQNEVVRHKWAEPHYTDAESARQYADEVDGIVVDLDTATDIFGDIPDDAPVGGVAVIVPLHMTARELTRFEDKVYGKLKPQADGSMVESPVYRKLDLAAKEVRDKFDYYEDAEGRLVDPPEGPGAGPSQRPSGRPSSRQQSSAPETEDAFDLIPNTEPAGPPTPRNPSTLGPDDFREEPSSLAAGDATALPPTRKPPIAPQGDEATESPVFYFTADRIARKLGVSPEEAQRIALQLNGGRHELPSVKGEELNSDDFIPSREELGSDDFIQSGEALDSDAFVTRSAEELNSEDFQIQPEGKPTPRLRDLRRRAVNKGPQKGDFENHNDYLMARARWRFQSGKATAGDKARFQKTAEAMPDTQRVPGSSPVAESEVPVTRRSISPPEDATPLSLLAGNELAMDVPESPDIVAPDPRSSEAKRMGDLTAQTHEDAVGQVRNVEERLGPMEPEDRIKSVLGILSKKLGREVTKEDLIRAGLITGGVAAALSDDEGVQSAGAMAVTGGAGGFKKGFPRQLEAKLDDGTVVKGFSALRRKQHDLQTGVETAKRRVGASNEKTVKDRVMEYNLQDNIDFDRELLAEAKKLGLDRELRIAAATRVYPKLKRQAWGGSNKGSLEGVASFLGLRADKLLEILSGTPRNPFDRSSGTLMGDNFREQLNLKGGRVGARHGDTLKERWFDENEDEKKKGSNATR